MRPTPRREHERPTYQATRWKLVERDELHRAAPNPKELGDMARERVLADTEYFRGLADSEREPRQTCARV